MVESKSQIKHFTAVALDFPQNRVGRGPAPPGPHANYGPVTLTVKQNKSFSLLGTYYLIFEKVTSIT